MVTYGRTSINEFLSVLGLFCIVCATIVQSSQLTVYYIMNISLVQALYFCAPFREQLLEHYANNKSVADVEENLLTCLADLFSQVILIFEYDSCFIVLLVYARLMFWFDFSYVLIDGYVLLIKQENFYVVVTNVIVSF